MKSKIRLALALAALSVSLLPRLASADEVTGTQRRGAEEYLAAAASGNPQTLASAIHPAELDRLRLGVMNELRQESQRGESSIRTRLFGSATSLAELERLTSATFFAQLARRLQFGGRPFRSVKGLATIPEGKDRVHVLVKGRQPEGRGETEVVALVTLLPYGKDWKGAVSSELEAQIEDLLAGREPVRLVAGGARSGGGSAAGVATAGGAGGAAASGVQGAGSAGTGAGAGGSGGLAAGAGAGNSGAGSAQNENSPQILAMLSAAEKALVDGRCDTYYKESLSPNFRRALSGRALDSLITTCRNSLGTRELLIAALRVVRKSKPRYEYDGRRASYDVSGEGLPFEQFVLEQIDGRWYVAE